MAICISLSFSNKMKTYANFNEKFKSFDNVWHGPVFHSCLLPPWNQKHSKKLTLSLFNYKNQNDQTSRTRKRRDMHIRKKWLFSQNLLCVQEILRSVKIIAARITDEFISVPGQKVNMQQFSFIFFYLLCGLTVGGKTTWRNLRKTYYAC